MTRARPLRTGDYLAHIVEAINLIQSYVEGMDALAFKKDRKTQDAVIRNLEIIGEACRNVLKHDPVFAQKNAQVPWGFAYEMRNALAHGYFTVDMDIVWATVTTNLPGLHSQVQALRFN